MSDTSSVPSVRQKRYGLVHDWHWVVNHSWAHHFTVLAFLFSVVEAFLSSYSAGHFLYACTMSAITGTATVLRFVAQREIGTGNA